MNIFESSYLDINAQMFSGIYRRPGETDAELRARVHKGSVKWCFLMFVRKLVDNKTPWVWPDEV